MSAEKRSQQGKVCRAGVGNLTEKSRSCGDASRGGGGRNLRVRGAPSLPGPVTLNLPRLPFLNTAPQTRSSPSPDPS